MNGRMKAIDESLPTGYISNHTSDELINAELGETC